MEKNVIWKYEIELGDDFVLDIPANGEILHLAVENDKPYIWVKINPYNKGVKRHFITYGTGQGIVEKEDQLIYISSFKLNGWLIQHLFEKI